MKRLLDHLATGFQVGRLPFAPGTFGSLWGLPIAWLFSQIGPLGYVAGSLSLTIGAIFVAEWYEQQAGHHDSSEIVIDEVAGVVTALALLPVNWKTLIIGFVLFRLFDILKPFPISYLDKNIKGGLGVVIDDVAAGIVSNVILQVVFVKTTLLGV